MMQVPHNTHPKMARPNFVKGIFSAIAVFFLFGIGLVLWQNLKANQALVNELALKDAKNFSITISQFRNFYSDASLPILSKGGLPVSHNYLQNPKSFTTLPEVFVREFPEYIEAKKGYQISLYSDLPLSDPTRLIRLDAFQKEAIAYLTANPGEAYWKVELIEGQDVLRYARPDLLDSSCVACHNNLPNAQKTDWIVGDLRGVLEIQRPLSFSSKELEGIWQPFLLMAVIALSVLFLLAILMHRLQHSLSEVGQALDAESYANQQLKIEAEQRKQLTQELMMNQNKNHTIMNSVLDVIIVINTKGIITEVNEAIESVFGYRVEEVLGKNIKILMPSPYKESHDGYLSTYSHSQKKNIIGSIRRVQGQKKSGEIFDIDLAVSEVKLNDSVLFTGLIRDVTEQVQAELDMQNARDEAIESANLKAEFLANMSHEIRTPMNGVIGMTNLLLETSLNDEQKNYAETVANSATSLLQIINDILDFSKIEAGKLEINYQETDLLSMVEGAMSVVGDKAHDKRLRFVYYVDVSLAKFYQMDELRTRQILVNLMSNAIKFTETGSVFISIRPHQGDDNREGLQFDVMDTGIGIPENAQSILFDAFSQVDGSTTRRYGGTGLGLSICKQLVELMSGHISVQSEAGQGSTFSFNLPVRACTETPCLASLPYSVNALVFLEEGRASNVMVQQLKPLNIDVVCGHEIDSYIESLRHTTPKTLAVVDITSLENCFPSEEQVQQAINRLVTLQRPIAWMVTSQQFQHYQASLEGKTNFRVLKPIKLSKMYEQIAKLMSGSVADLGQLNSSIEHVVIPPEKADKQPDSEEKSFHILVVEDNIINQKLALALLKKMGYTTDVAENGEVALQKIAENHYDLILMDCQMPVKDGYATTRALRKWDNHLSQLPVIAMTANAMKGDDQKCYDAGMDDYLTKPINATLLAEKIQFYVDKTTQSTE